MLRLRSSGMHTMREHSRSGNIRYAAASAQRLPFRDAAFDFATAFMSLMDIPGP